MLWLGCGIPELVCGIPELVCGIPEVVGEGICELGEGIPLLEDGIGDCDDGIPELELGAPPELRCGVLLHAATNAANAAISSVRLVVICIIPPPACPRLTADSGCLLPLR
jgi:hypothetical protein